jgi:putative NADH-flavin reductase
MRILVFGATGRIGRQVVQSATARGHEVMAFAHQPDPLIGPGLSPAPAINGKAVRPVLASKPGVTVVTGDVFDPATLRKPVAEADAVVFAVGSPGRGPSRVRSAGIAAVIAEMRASGVRRLVAVSPSAIAIGPGVTLARKVALRYFVHKLYRNPFLDAERMEDELRISDLDWSLIRSAPVRDWPATGGFQVMPQDRLRHEWPVSAADLADFIVAHTAEENAAGDTLVVTGLGRRPVRDPRQQPAMPGQPAAQRQA